MLPQYERLGAVRSTTLFRIPFPKVSLLTVALPLAAFVFCIVWSLLFFFDRSTSTHCGVPNLLPSISAAIGNYEPQRTVWQSAIVLSTFPRLMITDHYLNYYQIHIRPNRALIATTACLLNLIENLALVGLSLWTSADNYEMHKICFMVFIATSELYMATSYFVNKYGRKYLSKLSPIEERSLRYKRNLCIINVSSFCLAGYCFLRHNARCEPYMYSLFALAEYSVVLTNMAFHVTAALDFHDKFVMFNWKSGFHMSPA